MSDFNPFETEDLRAWGYAPGSYVFKCCDCPTDLDIYDRMGRLGDKRSWRCEEHARAARDADAALSQTLPAPGEVEEAKRTINDALMDSQYLAGITAGWNAAQSGDAEASLAALLKSREGHLSGFKEAKATVATVAAANDEGVAEVLEQAVERMRSEPFADDAHLLWTTQQDERMVHYAMKALAGCTASGFVVTRALTLARDLIETIEQTSGNVWFVNADDPETAVCDTSTAVDKALATVAAANDEGVARASNDDPVGRLAIRLAATANEAEEEHGEWTWREIAGAAIRLLSQGVGK